MKPTPEHFIDMCEYCTEPVELGQDYAYSDYVGTIFVGEKDEDTLKAKYKNYVPVYHKGCNKEKGE